ncbi:hypothetical protein N5919_11875, partial [Glaesserella parasuis]|nr:hypothetical protein [Glaesserella parasuis]
IDAPIAPTIIAVPAVQPKGFHQATAIRATPTIACTNPTLFPALRLNSVFRFGLCNSLSANVDSNLESD